MKLITRDTDYAIRALIYIARAKKKVVSVSKMANELSIPRPFLRKNLQLLDKEGIVKSYKGKGGGFVLRLAPERIFVLDLIRIFQGQFKLNECFLRKHLCPHMKHCVLKQKIDGIEKYVVKKLASINIAHL